MQNTITVIPDDLHADMCAYLPQDWVSRLVSTDMSGTHAVDADVIIKNGGTNAIASDTRDKYITNQHRLIWLVEFIVFTSALLAFNTIYQNPVVFLVTAVVLILLELCNLSARDLRHEKCKYANSVINRISYTIIRQCDSEIIVAEQTRSGEYKILVDKLLVDINAINAEHLHLYEFIAKENKPLALRFINRVRNPKPAETISLVVHSTKIH